MRVGIIPSESFFDECLMLHNNSKCFTNILQLRKHNGAKKRYITIPGTLST